MQHEHYTHTAPDIPSSTALSIFFFLLMQLLFLLLVLFQDFLHNLLFSRPILHFRFDFLLEIPRTPCPDQRAIPQNIVHHLFSKGCSIFFPFSHTLVWNRIMSNSCAACQTRQDPAFRHDPLQGLVGRNARQDLPLEVVLLFLACICIFSQQRTQAHIESGVQFLCPRGKALCRSLPEITGKIGFLPLHRPLPFLFVSAVAVGPAGGKGVLPHKICHTARFAHGVVQTAQSRGQVVQP